MIAMHEENKKSFLDELHSLDEATKKKVVIVATALIMIGVVYLWLGYFNGLIGKASQASNMNDQSQTVQQNTSSPSFGENFKKGIATIGADFAGMAKAFLSVIESPGKYVVHPQ